MYILISVYIVILTNSRQSETYNAQEAKFDFGYRFAFWFNGGSEKTHCNINNNNNIISYYYVYIYNV